MQTPAFYEALLGLPSEWRVSRVEVDHEDRIIDIHLEYEPSTAPDPSSGESLPIYDLRPSRAWRHLDTMQYRTYLHAQLPRVRRKDGTVVTIAIPWSEASSRHTWFFECWAIEVLLATKNQTQAARLLQLSFHQIHRIMHRAVDRGVVHRQRSLKEGTQRVTTISIDEKCYKYRRFLTIVSDPTTGSILEVADGRTTEAAIEAINRALPAQRRNEVTTATIDMAAGYHNAVRKTLKKAWIVYDKFHLFMHLTQAIDKTRRHEVASQPVLKKTRFLWLKNKERHTEAERNLFGRSNMINLTTATVWRMRENFRDMYSCTSPNEARNYFLRWLDHVEANGTRFIKEVAKTFREHMGGIINYFYDKSTNAMAERLNGKIQELKVIGKGYRDWAQLRIAILFFYGNLNLAPHKSY